jgi:hypothetical protein
MAESKKEKAGRLQQRRDKQQAKREKTSDTPEAAAERHKSEKASDRDRLQQLGERTGVFG